MLEQNRDIPLIRLQLIHIYLLKKPQDVEQIQRNIAMHVDDCIRLNELNSIVVIKMYRFLDSFF